MNPDISFLHELWDGVRSFVPKKERLQIAESIVRSFNDHADIDSVEDHLNEFDSVMRTALITILDIGMEDQDDEDDYGDW